MEEDEKQQGKSHFLALFRPGGGGWPIVPALSLDVYNCFHKLARPNKLGDFS